MEIFGYLTEFLPPMVLPCPMIYLSGSGAINLSHDFIDTLYPSTTMKIRPLPEDCGVGIAKIIRHNMSVEPAPNFCFCAFYIALKTL